MNAYQVESLYHETVLCYASHQNAFVLAWMTMQLSLCPASAAFLVSC